MLDSVQTTVDTALEGCAQRIASDGGEASWLGCSCLSAPSWDGDRHRRPAAVVRQDRH
jgi:hypothetical protein